MTRTGLLYRLIVTAAMASFCWGCSSTANEQAIVDANGKHPARWAVDDVGGTHPGMFLSSPAQCFMCHGTNLYGGTSGVSCFTASRNGISCHPQGPSAHPEGFSAPSVHGARAMSAPEGVYGFVFCQKCHGTGFSGATMSTGAESASCTGCHGNGAAHPSTWDHDDTDEGNVAACAECHTAGENLSTPFLPRYASGTPGCFNSTLCHGEMGHDNDPQPWTEPQNHGSAAKGSPGGDPLLSKKGFAYCKTCHGDDYRGGVTGVSCVNQDLGCHVSSMGPHPQYPWRGTAVTHTSTSTDNSPECARCHLNGVIATTPAPVPADVTPGCFNNTLCHGVKGHPDGWSDPTQHGAAAKADPAGGQGLQSCMGCHGSNLQGDGSVPGCMSCHTSAPHPDEPWRSSTWTHTTTNNGNAAACYICHHISSSGTPSCFNNTLCHGSEN